MKFIGIIPARYASTRFPGKPLADLAGKPMIQRVYEQVQNVLDSVCVATDDNRIEAAVQAFGGNVIMTFDQHKAVRIVVMKRIVKSEMDTMWLLTYKVTNLLSNRNRSKY